MVYCWNDQNMHAFWCGGGNSTEPYIRLPYIVIEQKPNFKKGAKVI